MVGHRLTELPLYLYNKSNMPLDKETQEKIKKIWDSKKDEKKLHRIFMEDLGDFYDVNHFDHKSKEWLQFLQMAGEWIKDDKRDRMEHDLETLTEDGILKIQEDNRKRTVLMLREILNSYEKNPNKFKTISITEVRKWYKTIQSMEEAMKRTHISRGKLKLEAVRTLMPYNQLEKLPPDKLKKLKEQVNASFDRISQLRGEGEDGPAVAPTG